MNNPQKKITTRTTDFYFYIDCIYILDLRGAPSLQVLSQPGSHQQLEESIF